MDQGKLATLEQHYAEAQTKAVEAAQAKQQALDKVQTEEAERAAAEQAATAANIAKQLTEVRKHVHYLSTKAVQHVGRPVRVVGCITYGLVRVLDAAVLGSVAERLRLPSGQSDDSCAPITAVDLAESVASNYGTARLNAQQLDGLIRSERELQAVRARASRK